MGRALLMAPAQITTKRWSENKLVLADSTRWVGWRVAVSSMVACYNKFFLYNLYWCGGFPPAKVGGSFRSVWLTEIFFF
jgi:hypothetical protein